MKKLLLYFSFFFFYFIPCNAQDTIALVNGHKMNVKVISFSDEIVYSIPPDNKQFSLKPSSVSYIKYSDGSVYTVKQNDKPTGDTNKVRQRPYILISGGTSVPLFGLSATSNNPDVTVNGQYCGFASQGSAFTATAGYDFLWLIFGGEITAAFKYFHNRFDADAIANQNNYSFIDRYGFNTINATGNYFYTNYSLLTGGTFNIEYKWFRWGITLTTGVVFSKIDDINAPVTNYLGYGGIISNPNYTYKLTQKSPSALVVELGTHIDIRITPHIFLSALLGFQVSEMTISGTYQYTDNSTGGAIRSGSYSGGGIFTNIPSSFFAGYWDVTGGIGYDFK